MDLGSWSDQRSPAATAAAIKFKLPVSLVSHIVDLGFRV